METSSTAFVLLLVRPLVPYLVPTDFLPSANSLRSISLQVAQLVGPAIAAGIIALGGTSLAFALDGASFQVG